MKTCTAALTLFTRIAISTAVIVATAPGGLVAQDTKIGEVARKMTGTWKLNRELSPNLGGPGRRERGGGPGLQPLFALQRGGGGRGGGGGGAAAGGDSPLMPEEVAAQTALSVLHQVPMELAIAATTAEITFTDPRGEWAFRIDDKTTSMDVPGGKLRVKTKWDRLALKQEFSSTQRKLIKLWSIDADDRLTLRARIESLSFNSVESKAVFDRQ